MVIIKSGDIAGGHLAQYFVTSFQPTGLHILSPLEFYSTIKNQNKITNHMINQ